MNSQLNTALDRPVPGPGWRLAPGTAMRVRHGRLQVLAGHVWLTRRGDLQDHVLESGQTIAVRDGDAALIEPWGAGRSAVVSWQSPSLLGRAQAVVDSGVASALGAAAALCGSAGGLLVHVAETLAARARAPSSGAGRCSA